METYHHEKLHHQHRPAPGLVVPFRVQRGIEFADAVRGEHILRKHRRYELGGIRLSTRSDVVGDAQLCRASARRSKILNHRTVRRRRLFVHATQRKARGRECAVDRRADQHLESTGKASRARPRELVGFDLGHGVGFDADHNRQRITDLALSDGHVPDFEE